MIISHAYRFIFVKTRKTAGTSIEIALSKHCGPKDIITPIHPDDEAIRRELGYRVPQNYIRPFRSYRARDWWRFLRDGKRQNFKNHLPGPRIRQMISREIWNSYYKFCVERNPFDKTISAYYWAMSERERKGLPRLSLDDFVYSDLVREYSDWHRYSDNAYKPIVDRVLRFERLQEELDEVCLHLGMPKLELPKAKSTQRRDKRPAAEVLGSEAMRHLKEHVFSLELSNALV